MRSEQEIRERYEMFKKKEIPEALKYADMESYASLTAMREAVLMEYEFIFGRDFDEIMKDKISEIENKIFEAKKNSNLTDELNDFFERIKDSL